MARPQPAYSRRCRRRSVPAGRPATSFFKRLPQGSALRPAPHWPARTPLPLGAELGRPPPPPPTLKKAPRFPRRPHPPRLAPHHVGPARPAADDRRPDCASRRGPPFQTGREGEGGSGGEHRALGAPCPCRGARRRSLCWRVPALGPAPSPRCPLREEAGPQKPPPRGLRRAPTSCPQPRGAGVNCPPACGPGRGSAPRPQGRREVEEPPARQSARRARPVVAFLVAFHQNKQLIGDRGLLPCRAYLQSVQRHFGGRVSWDALSYAPTILWLLDWSHMDANLDALALLGLGISSFILVSGCANMVLMAALWVLYMSLVNVGQIWYSFGWESQLLETGFLGIFLCPLWTLSALPRGTPTSWVVMWGFRWLIFRIMLGAGLIKIRGDRCWRDLTCMDFHYETQPVPNPVAYFLHRSPWWFHRFETLSNHFLELVVPFFIFLGRRMCIVHGALQVLFQVVLIISGNLSFLNWLTIVPSLACFDDATLGGLFPSGPGRLKDQVLKIQEEETRGARAPRTRGSVARGTVNLALGILVAWLSIPVVLNLLSPRQVMNSSFNPLRIVNTYGAFGSITRERTEVILQGTASANASAPDSAWEDYEFKCKPGDPRRRPCLISPYHHRLDWLMWFAAFQTYEHNEWIIHLAGKLLANDAQALSLLARNPFEGRDPPRWVRGEHYRYKFSRPGGRHAAEGKWWIRRRLGPYFPPLSRQDLRGYFTSRQWPYPEPE